VKSAQNVNNEILFFCYRSPDEYEFGWKYYTKDQLIQYIQEYRKEITSQMEWVDNYKMLFSFRSNEVKTLRAETEELR